MARLVLIVACILATTFAPAAVAGPHHHHHVRVAPMAPAPAPVSGSDCSSLVYNLVDCVAYMTIPPVANKPGRDCCEGYLTLMNEDPECSCYSIRQAISMGFSVNLTRALSLATTCKVDVPYVDCHIDEPSYSPAAPAPTPSLPSPVAPTPKTPSPVAPSPKTPSPVAPAPKTPSPAAPAPKTPSTVAPAPKTPSPIAEAPESAAAVPAGGSDEAPAPAPAALLKGGSSRMSASSVVCVVVAALSYMLA